MYNYQQTQLITGKPKSKALAYLLWFLFGGIGVHRFYLGSPVAGILLIVLLAASIFLVFPFIVLVPWLIIDLFWINGRVNSINRGEIR